MNTNEDEEQTVANSNVERARNDAEVPEPLTSRTENATNINPKDASTKKQRKKFSRLSKYNRGIWNGPRREKKEITRRQDNIAIFDSLASQLELTSYQKKKGRRTLDRLDLRRVGLPTNLIAFSICVLVANDDVPDGYRYWPRANNTDADFRRVSKNFPHDVDSILSAMMRVDELRDEEKTNV